MTYRHVSACLALCAFFLLASLPMQAAAADWYRVEVLVFAQENPHTQERFDPTILPHYDHSAVQLSAGIAGLPNTATSLQKNAAKQGAWESHSRSNNYPVSAMASRMERSGKYRTLFYGRWKQPFSPYNKALPILITGGKTLQRYPQTAPMQPNAQPTISNTAMPAQQPTVTTSNAIPELQGTITLNRTRFAHIKTNLWFAGQRGDTTFFTHLDQSRQLKSGELHYLDNPLFGVVVRVTKLGD